MYDILESKINGAQGKLRFSHHFTTSVPRMESVDDDSDDSDEDNSGKSKARIKATIWPLLIGEERHAHTISPLINAMSSMYCMGAS